MRVITANESEGEEEVGTGSMGVPEDDPTATEWLAEGGLAKHAHRRGYAPPRIVDDEYLERFDARTRILRWLLEHFEDEFLTKLKPLVDSALAKGPLGGGASDLKALPFTLVAHRYLFLRLDSGDWIEPLVKAGFYDWPPAASVDGDGSYFPSVVESAFLVEHAGERPDEVCAAVLAIPDTENPLVVQDIFEIAEVLPTASILSLVPKLLECLRHSASMPWRLALPAVRRLRDDGHTDEARELALGALARGIDESGMARDERQEAIDLLSSDGVAEALVPGVLIDTEGDALAELRRLQWMEERTTGFFVTEQSPLAQEDVGQNDARRVGGLRCPVAALG